MGWDHERCRGPMLAAAARWRELCGDEIAWDFRPLASFNDQPVAELAASYDLIVIDHPFVGTAAATRCLAPLDELVAAETLALLDADTVGPSHTSYGYCGRQWAVATDAACQVAAARDDLLPVPPQTWDDVLALAQQEPGRMAMPLDPTDAICSLLTLCAARGSALGEDSAVDEDAVAYLSELVPNLHPDSFGFNPPRLLDRMSTSDEIAYVPLVFGYTNYSRSGRPERRLRFLDLPTPGSVLGGAGLAVSAGASDPMAAAAFAGWVAGAEAQREVVFPSGGQPASRTVWRDPAADALAGGFFSGTVDTIEAAHVRPRDPWWPAFQARGGKLLAAGLREGKAPGAIARGLAALRREVSTKHGLTL